MHGADQKRFNLGRRDFIKTMTVAGVAATLPGGTFADISPEKVIRPKRAGGKRNLLCLSDNPAVHEKYHRFNTIYSRNQSSGLFE